MDGAIFYAHFDVLDVFLLKQDLLLNKGTPKLCAQDLGIRSTRVIK